MEVVKEWFTYKGRISRQTFIIRSIVGLIIAAVCLVIYEPRWRHVKNMIDGSAVYIIIGLIGIWILYANINKRLHDIGRGSVWTLLMMLLATCGGLIWFIPYLYLVFKKGVVGVNEYGLDPLQTFTSRKEREIDDIFVQSRTSNGDNEYVNQDTVHVLSEVKSDQEKGYNALSDRDSGTDQTDNAGNATETADVDCQQSIGLGDLWELKKLLDEGVITQKDFDAAKKKILGQ